jgi:hypothetical protein
MTLSSLSEDISAVFVSPSLSADPLAEHHINYYYDVRQQPIRYRRRAHESSEEGRITNRKKI